MGKKKKLKTEVILLSAFTGLESAHVFSAFLPSIFTIQGLAVPQGQQNMIRKGYLPSIAFSLALGGIVSALTKSKLPIAFALGTCGFMVLTYEAAIFYAPPPILSEEPSVATVTDQSQIRKDIVYVKV